MKLLFLIQPVGVVFVVPGNAVLVFAPEDYGFVVGVDIGLSPGHGARDGIVLRLAVVVGVALGIPILEKSQYPKQSTGKFRLRTR